MAPTPRIYPAPGQQGHQDRHFLDPASEYAGGDGQRPQGHPDWGKPLPKGDKQPSPQSGRIRQKEDDDKEKQSSITRKVPIPSSRNNSNPGSNARRLAIIRLNTGYRG